MIECASAMAFANFLCLAFLIFCQNVRARQADLKVSTPCQPKRYSLTFSSRILNESLFSSAVANVATDLYVIDLAFLLFKRSRKWATEMPYHPLILTS